MNKLTGIAASGISMVLALTLVGCGGQKAQDTSKSQEKPAESAQKDTKKAASLADWKGVWNSIDGYLDEKELDATYEEVAKRDNKKPEDVKNEMRTKTAAEFKGIEVTEDSITFLDGFKDKDGKEIAKSKYEFVEAKKVKHGGAELEWNIFKATDKDAKYPYMMLMGVHGEEELVHFHLRFGASVEEMEKKTDWYPTFVKPSTTLDQIKGEIKE